MKNVRPVALKTAKLYKLCGLGDIIHRSMTRGNQRDVDRERARKRNADQNKQKKDGPTWEKAKEDHAEIMRTKQKAFEEKKGG